VVALVTADATAEITTVALAPDATVPSEAATADPLFVHLPIVVVHDTKESPFGKESLSVVF